MKSTEQYTKARQLGTLLLTTAISISLFSPVAVLAQDADDEGIIEEVIVMGIRQSLDSAAAIKRTSDSIVDAITSEDLGLFSDNNIGEALQRVPGVQLERSEGEGYRISIRGLGPRFVRTTLNGRTALSSPGGEGGSDSRGFSFNVIPSEVTNRATIHKTSQAMDIEGGIGGFVDIQTARPLDVAASRDKDFYVAGALRSALNDIDDLWSERGSIFLNKKVNDNFGFFLAAALERSDRRQESAESQDMDIQDFRLNEGTILNGQPVTEEYCGSLGMPWSSSNAYCDIEAGGIFDGLRNIRRDRTMDRDTFTTGLQWQPNDNLEVYADWTHGKETRDEEQFRYWQRVEGALGRLDRSDSPTNITDITINFADADDFTDGVVTAFSFENFSEDSPRQFLDVANVLINDERDFDVGGINFKWTNDDWTAAFDLGYAAQQREFLQKRVQGDVDFTANSDPARFPLYPRSRPDPWSGGLSGTFDITSGVPIVHFEDANGVTLDPLDLTDVNFDQDRQTYVVEDNSEKSMRLDFVKDLPDRSDGDLISFFDTVKFGVSYREREGYRNELRTSGNAFVGGSASSIANYLDLGIAQFGTNLVTGFMNDITDPNFFHSFVVPDIRGWIAADPMGTFAVAPQDGIQRQNVEYNIGEEITAYYFQLGFSNDDARFPYRGNIGVRYAETDQSSAGALGVQSGDNFVPLDPDNPYITTYRNYDDTLPSANIAFDLTDNWIFRLAASQTVTRPDPVDLRQGWDLDDIDGTDNEGNAGNPNLEPYRTDNYDAILEYYPESGGAYAIGVFHKKLDGFIADGEEIVPIDLTPFDPDLGFQDFEIQRPVNTDGGDITGFELAIHQPFDAFTDGFFSHFGVNFNYTWVDAELQAVRGSGRLVELRGTSKWSYNLVTYFENGPFSARLAYNDRAEFLHQEAVASNDFDEYTEGQEYVDLNLDYRFNRNWRLRFSANNLTDSQRYRVWGTTSGSRYFGDQRDDGRSYVLELRASM